MKVHVPAFSAAALVDEMREQGATLRLEGGVPKVRWGALAPTPALIEELARLRADIIALLEQEKRDVTPVPLGEARALVDAVRTAGATIALVDGKVRVTRPDLLLAATIERLKQNRDAVVRLLEREQRP